MKDQTHTLPGTLRKFLEKRLARFNEPPDADWVEGVAVIYDTTTEVVWSAVRQLMPHAPAAPLPLTWTRPDIEAQVGSAFEVRPFDPQHPFDRVLNALRARSCRILPKQDARGREARRATCPAHDDRNPSLVVTMDGTKALLHCFGGCSVVRIVAALGLKLADLFSGPPEVPGRRRRQPQVVRPTAVPRLSPEERQVRKRQLTAARTRRWRERHQTGELVTLQNIRSVTCDAGDAGDAPNVLQVTSQDEVPRDLSLSVQIPVVREISVSVSVHPDVGQHQEREGRAFAGDGGALGR